MPTPCPFCRYLEIRLVRRRDRGLRSPAVELERVFGADMFLPFAQRPRISDGRGPRHGEDAVILHRECQLQVLARKSAIEVQRTDANRKSDVLFVVAGDCRFGFVLIDEPIALDAVHGATYYTPPPRGETWGACPGDVHDGA